MSLVLKRRVGESVVARPMGTEAPDASEDAEPEFQGRRGGEAVDWRISLTVVEIRPNFAVLQVETTAEVGRVLSPCAGMHFLTPNGAEVGVRVDVRGHTAAFMIDAPSSVLLLRGELEGPVRRAAARPVGV